ncbi:MAG TPA: N-acetylmuramoyl-L-alanine amidase [Verrucomicrobiae bacterium]|nr:N-acetylmuramoyl-L-alanine amidase [Verrucomicrobiae bacterium]
MEIIEIPASPVLRKCANQVVLMDKDCATDCGTRRGLRLALLLAGIVTCQALSREQTYIVKAGDTLFGIARRNDTSVTRLTERNGLSRSGHIYVGQRLIIPDQRQPAADSGLNASVRKAIANARVSPGRWKYIVLHHSAVDEGNPKSLDRYHREVRRMENGLAYHFLIGNGHGMKDGEIAIGNRWRKQLDGGHLHSEAQNKVALGICLIGDFDKHPPTPQQLRSLEALVEALMQRCKLDAGDVRTHQQINVVGTRCPGSKFPTRSFLSKLKAPAG